MRPSRRTHADASGPGRSPQQQALRHRPVRDQHWYRFFEIVTLLGAAAAIAHLAF